MLDNLSKIRQDLSGSFIPLHQRAPSRESRLERWQPKCLMSRTPVNTDISPKSIEAAKSTGFAFESGGFPGMLPCSLEPK